MYFTTNTSLLRYEVMMQGIPNFLPRGYGTYIYHLSEICFTIPYSRAVKQQMLDGKLYQAVNDKKFNDKFRAITEKVV